MNVTQVKKDKEENSNSNNTTDQFSKDKENKDSESNLPSVFKERECQTCNILRPKFTSHCRACDNCIMNFDQ